MSALMTIARALEKPDYAMATTPMADGIAGASQTVLTNSPIQIHPASVMAKVREMAITAGVRTIKSTPKAMRGAVTAGLQ